MDTHETELPRLPPRQADSHKGNYGSALLIGGSRGMAGSVSLAGMAALRGGAGLVRLAVPEIILSTVAGFEPSYMTVALATDLDGRIAAASHDRIAELAEKAHYAVQHHIPSSFDCIAELAKTSTAIAIGPGLGRSPGLDDLVTRLYREIPNPMVFDADALNALASARESLPRPGGPRIFTPHPGEFARLINQKLEGDARNNAAVQLAARCKIVVLLKGYRTLVTDGRRSAINTSGNPGMATGGAGDVLTGLTTSLLCQGLEPFDAARLAAYLHGRAGDLAAEDVGETSLIASDLVRYLPKAFLECWGAC
jgi:ADP-dependent NAD(P)H-hydrate dehydratase